MATVLGIGVAVMTRTCGRLSAALARSASRCSTPNLCCSSITTRPEVGELDLLLEQGVGADHDAGVAGEHVGQRRSPGGRPDRPGEQGHAGGVLGRAQLAGLGQRAEHAGDDR